MIHTLSQRIGIHFYVPKSSGKLLSSFIECYQPSYMTRNHKQEIDNAEFMSLRHDTLCPDTITGYYFMPDNLSIIVNYCTENVELCFEYDPGTHIDSYLPILSGLSFASSSILVAIGIPIADFGLDCMASTIDIDGNYFIKDRFNCKADLGDNTSPCGRAVIELVQKLGLN